MTFAMAKSGKWICHAQHHEGYLCTRERAHKGVHAAHDDEGVVVKTWRGGRAIPKEVAHARA